MQASEIDVSSIHHVEGARFDRQVIEYGHIVRFPVSYADKTGNVAPQVDQRVKLHGTFVTTKSRPRKQGKTKIDSCGIQGVGGLFERYCEVVLGVQGSGATDEHLSEVGVDPPVATLVGIAEGAPGNLAAKPGVVQFR